MHTPRFSRAARVALLGLALSALGGLGLVALASAHEGPGPGGWVEGPPSPVAPGLLGLPTGGPALQHLLDAAGATAAQRARIEQLLAPARVPAADLRADEQADRESLVALFRAPEVDAQAVEAVRARMAGRREAAARQMTAAVVAAANVLSPDQRQILAARWPPAGGPHRGGAGRFGLAGRDMPESPDAPAGTASSTAQ